MNDQRVVDLERTFRNAARRARRDERREAVIAYNYAAWLTRQALKEDD